MNNVINSKQYSLRLSSSTPLQALDGKAARAAVIAQAEHKANQARRDKPKHNQQNRRPLTEIERDLKHIFNHIKKTDADKVEVRLKKPTWFSSAACIICAYDLDDIAKHHTAMKTWEETGRQDKKPKDPGPKRTFAFYASTLNPQRLGSVAIYGPDVDKEYKDILKRGSIFGIPFSTIKIDFGLRPFLDITFRP